MSGWWSFPACLLCAVRVAAAGLAPEDERVIAALPVVPPGLNAGHALEIRAVQTVATLHRYSVFAPDLKAEEWTLFTPRPPMHAGQRILSAATTPPAEAVRDLSPLAQPLLRSRVLVKTPEQQRGMTIDTRIEAELSSRRLVQRVGGPAEGNPAPALADGERRLFLRRTPQFDYQDPRVGKWIAEHGLKRRDGEGEVDLARRVFLVIVRSFSYEYLGEQDRAAGHVCAAGKSDCGGLAVLFATVLRSQGVPARTLAGRWAVSAKPGDKVGEITYYQEHVKAEFFAQGVGWVPADLSSAILHDHSASRLEYFGRDRGDFLTLHFDNDLSLDTRHFGVRPIRLLQRPSYWVRGAGSVRNAVIRENWTVKRLEDR